MENLPMHHRLKLSGEGLQNYSSDLFNKLTSWVKLTRQLLIEDANENVVKGVEEEFTKICIDYTGINAYPVIGKRDLSMRIPDLNKNHPLIYPWIKSFIKGKEAHQLFDKKDAVAYGWVDHTTGKVGGNFTNVPIRINIPKKALVKGRSDLDIESETIAAGICHELGHAYAYFAFFSRTYTTNFVLQSLHERLAKRPEGNAKITIIANSLDALNDKSKLEAAKLAEIDDPEIIGVAILGEAVNQSVSEFGHSVYDHTSWEQIADEYAVRHGAGVWLVKALHEVYSESINIETRPLPVYLVVEFIKVVFGVLLAPITIMLLLFDNSATSYDTPKARMNRIRNTLLSGLDGDKTLERDEIFALKENIEFIDNVMKNYEERRSVGEMILWLFSKENRRDRQYTITQKELENLSNHVLKLRVSEFKSLTWSK